MTAAEKTFNGLNGEIMLNTPDRGPGATGLVIGSVPGEPYGYKRSLKVTVDLRIEQRAGAYETVDHESIAGPLDFAITAQIWQPKEHDIVASGRDEIFADLDSHALGKDASDFLRRAADEWHLNAMQAGCAHQVILPEIPDGVGALDRIGWFLDNVPPCPVTGYKYGSKWLVKPLLDSWLRELLTVLDDPIEARRIYVKPGFPALVGIGGRD